MEKLSLLVPFGLSKRIYSPTAASRQFIFKPQLSEEFYKGNNQIDDITHSSIWNTINMSDNDQGTACRWRKTVRGGSF